ncbi:MAG: TerB family tellurite resistance protein [Calditrichaceae bacterium]|nr:TerB family tellurite resistance protein [Calditrichaceae bacterium]MBN2708802.1 TerB family tellurite resistance protein [Calditrichaceae bacterium]RQV97669.1 MAG: TerB family tellurite resistance protein [Calditrichota bacterium]
MNMNLMDRSNYFKGLLLLSKKDNKITPEEKESLLHLGRLLEFSEEFCTETIDELLHNNHIKETPVEFSNEECAKLFLKDGLKISFVDHVIDKKEFDWLQQVADINGIDDEWLTSQLAHHIDIENHHKKLSFEIEKHYKPASVKVL